MSRDGDERPPSLDGLEARLRKARAGRRPERPGAAPAGALGQALRLAVEMVAALIVGGGLGWFLDGWLDTRPWFMVVFLLLGAAAGTLNAYRIAMRMMPGAQTTDEDDGPKP